MATKALALAPDGDAEGVSLEAAIEQLANLGEKDPLVIVAKLEKRYGVEWLREQGAAHASDFAADIARRILGARRRSSEVRVLPGNVVAKSEMMVASICLYDEDGLPFWKPFGEATPEDLERKAMMLDGLAIGVLRRSRWYRECAELAKAEGAKDMGHVKAELPALPDADEIEL